MSSLTWVRRYRCTPTAWFLTDQQTSPLFLRRIQIAGNPLHLAGREGQR